MKKRTVALLFALLTALSLCACGGESDESSIIVDPNDPFTGDWLMITADGIYEFYYFYGNGTGCQQSLDIYVDFGYTYTEDTITFEYYIDTPPVVQTYSYSLDGIDLFLTNTDGGQPLHYVKQTQE